MNGIVLFFCITLWGCVFALVFGLEAKGQAIAADTLAYALPPLQDSVPVKNAPGSAPVTVDKRCRQVLLPFTRTVLQQPFVKMGGGYLAYNAYYRSNTDTPYAAQNLLQQTMNAQVNVAVTKFIPLSVSMLLSRSNSSFFRNITDVQVQVNMALLQQGWMDSYKTILLDSLKKLKDTALEKSCGLQQGQLAKIKAWLHHPLTLQQLVQANETIQVPGRSDDAALPDSVNRVRADSLKQLAEAFLYHYEHTKNRYDSLLKKNDSLTAAYTRLQEKIHRYNQLIGSIGGQTSWNTWAQQQKGADPLPPLPRPYQWIMGIRQFSVGKSPVNYSELTARNITLNGVNLEYSSWYYLALSAGWIDYRFRDVVLSRKYTAPQYMSLLRLGIGSLEQKHLILSVYQGKKQVYSGADSTAPRGALSLTGLSLEAKWPIGRGVWAVAEVAQSIAPDYRRTPIGKSSFNLKDKSSQAILLKLAAAIPQTQTRLEGSYKYTGSNFQSFSSYQTGASVKAWYLKGDQYLWKRKIKIAASLRSNDFVNPYIVQRYQSKAVFKSASIFFREKKLPVFSISYAPIAQLTVIDQQVVENRFQTLSATLSHAYRVGPVRLMSIASLNRFYNTNSDTAFVFYNARNVLLGQSFLFNEFTANVNVSSSSSAKYQLVIASEEVSMNVSPRIAVGLGIKLNTLNKTENKTGESMSLNYQVSAFDYLSVNLERGYLPGTTGGLRRNDFGSIQFVTRF